jgi:pimeloyl-ACP methyl ester carboxylesterase
MSDSGFCEHNGARLYYEVDGDGPPLTLIHAGIANLRMWDEQLPAFAEHHRVIRYDTRTFGHTTTEDVSFSNRDDLAAILDHLEVRETAVLGISRGGSIAVDFTLERPERVSALVAVAAGLGGFETRSPADEEELWDEYERRYEARDWDWVVETETAFWVDGPRQPAERVPAALRQRVRDWIAEGYRDHATEEPTSVPLDPPAVNRLSEIAVPTLVIVGDLDEGATVESCRRLATDIPDARLEVFEGAAHMVNLEQPERFTRLVLAFLAEAQDPRQRATNRSMRSIASTISS